MNNEQTEGSGYEKNGYQETKDYSAKQTFNSRDTGYTNNNGNRWGNKSNAQSGSGSNSFKRFQPNSNRNFAKASVDFNLYPPILYKPYFGTGNQDAPESALSLLEDIKNLLNTNKYTARTSAFDGPDKIFMTSTLSEIILPWRDFAGHSSKLTFTTEEAKYFAKEFFPKYDDMKDTVKTFLAKNVRLVCGQNLKSPAMFGIIWSEDGAETLSECSQRTGNMRHLISIANELRIPIFNVAKQDAKERLIQHFKFKQPLPKNNPDKISDSSHF